MVKMVVFTVALTPSAQNFLLPNLYFMFACLSNTISELFPFR